MTRSAMPADADRITGQAHAPPPTAVAHPRSGPKVKREQELIRRAQQGDNVAFGELVRQVQDRLFTSMVHLVGRHDAAEDIVQDALVQAFMKIRTFQSKSSFYTWVYRIAMRTAADRLRRQPREQSTDWRQSGNTQEPVDPGAAPANKLLATERAQQLRQALDQLPDDFRHILVLREIDGFDYAAIADILQISVGTVRSRLHRARTALRTMLDRRDQK